MRLYELESKKVKNNRTNEIYYYIGDSIDATNGKEGTVVALYHKDGEMYHKDKKEFLKNFTFISRALDEKKAFILSETYLDEDIVMNVLSEDGIEEFYLEAVKLNEISKRTIELIKEPDIRVGQAFSNALNEFGIELDSAFDCYYKDNLLPLAMNKVCSYYRWSIGHISKNQYWLKKLGGI